MDVNQTLYRYQVALYMADQAELPSVSHAHGEMAQLYLSQIDEYRERNVADAA